MLPLSSLTIPLGTTKSSLLAAVATNLETIYKVSGTGSGRSTTSPNDVSVKGIAIPSTSIVPTLTSLCEQRATTPEGTIFKAPSSSTILTACGVRFTIVT